MARLRVLNQPLCLAFSPFRDIVLYNMGFLTTSEQVIQISGNRLLTNKGRIFEFLPNTQGVFRWELMELPDFKADKQPINAVPKGETQFYEAISPKEAFDDANNIDDLLIK